MFLKRTKGRLLLTLLVITGLAGRVHDTTLNKQERKFAVTYLKNNRNDVLKEVKGLSEKQLNYKATPERWSVQECLYHIILAENGLWGMLETAMKEPPAPEKRVEIKATDEEILAGITDRSKKATAPEGIQPVKGPWKSMDEAVISFKLTRGNHIKYVKTTTEDLRNHVMPRRTGAIDGYQFILFISGHAQRHLEQIREIKKDPGFPAS